MKASKQKKKKSSKFIKFCLKRKSIVGHLLLLVDEIIMPLLFVLIWVESIGEVGFACAKCVTQNLNCFKFGFYYSYVKKLEIFSIFRVILSTLLVLNKVIIPFFKWTETGTIFDSIILRTFSTIVFTFFVLLIVFTPTLIVIEYKYLFKYSNYEFIAIGISYILPFGVLLWVVIVLYQVCYLSLTHLVKS